MPNFSVLAVEVGHLGGGVALRTTPLPFELQGTPMELLWRAAVDEDDACRFLRAKIVEVVGQQTLRRRETRGTPSP